MYIPFRNLITAFLAPKLMFCLVNDAGGGGGGDDSDGDPDAGRRSMSEIMADKFPVGEKPDEKPAEKPDEKPDEKPADKPDEKPAGDKAAKLPPGFTPGETEKPTKEADKVEEPSLEDLTKAIESEPNADKKVNLTKFRTKLTRQDEELTSLNSTIASLREAGLIDDQNKPVARQADPEIETKLTEAYDTIGRLSLAHDPRFQAKYQTPINNAISEVAKAINESPANDQEKQQALQAAQAIAMMSKTDRAAAITEHVPEALHMDVAIALREHDKLANERNQAIQSHQQVQQQLEQEHTITEQQRISQYRSAIKSEVTAEVETEGFLSRIPGNTEYNAFIDSIYSEVDEIFQSNDPKVQAKAMTLGAMAPVYRGMYEATQTKLQEVQVELAQYKQGKVTISRSGSETSLGDGTSPASAADIAKHLASKSQAHYK